MGQKHNLKLVILWADELRVAAKLLKELHEVAEKENGIELDGPGWKLLQDALRASRVALYDVDDSSVLVLTTMPYPAKRERRTEEST